MSSQIAEQISRVPELYESGEKSTAALLREMGFPQNDGAFSVAEVECALERDPELVDLWLARGHDQRYAGGWGLEQEPDGCYCLRDFGGGDCRMMIGDRVHACAEFAVRYVGFISDQLARA